MADSVSEELQLLTAERIWSKCSDSVNGIVLQTVPHEDPRDGILAYGERASPFISICEILPESYSETQGWHNRDLVTHTITAVIYAAKDTVEDNPMRWRLVRERAIRSIHRYRRASALDGTCIWYANARPQSFLSGAAWIQSGRFQSAFDLVFRTEEPRLHD